MTLQQLKIFCLIAEKGNISHAADEMCIAQPAMSKALSQLELELGAELFDRKGKRIVLNENGHKYYNQVKYALNLIDDANTLFIKSNESIKEKITVCVDTLIPYLAGLLTQFHETYPNIDLQISIYEDNKTMRAVGAYNVAITTSPDTKIENKEYTIIKDEFYLLMSKDHPLANESEVYMSALRDENFIYCCRAGDDLQDIYDAMCHLANFNPRVLIVGADLFVAATMVRNNQGVTIIPGSAVRWLTNEQLDDNVLVNIKSPKYQMPIYAVTPRGKEKSEATKAFLDFLQKHFSSLYPDGISGFIKSYLKDMK